MIEIIPAIDLIEGKCVRLSKGDFASKKIYNEDPTEVARRFEDHGIRRLHVVDLDGAKAGRIINYRVLERIAIRTSLIIDFGGGLKSDSDLEIAFESGARMVTGGSIAVKDPDTFQRWIDRFGGNRIILGSDCRRRKVSVGGWTEDTGEDILPFVAKWRQKGILNTICTDIDRDGMLEGPNIDLYREICAADPELFLIASGGVSSIRDVEELAEASIHGVIIGKAIYEGRIALKELLPFIEK